MGVTRDMATDLSQLVLPIALCNPNAIQKETQSNIDHLTALAHASCSSATPSSLIGWGFDTTEPESKELQNSRCGVAMGCTDGSLYLFHLDEKSKHDKDPPNHQITDFILNHPDSAHVFQVQARRPSSIHGPRSTSPSPSSSRSNLGIMSMPKPRAVSGLSKEQVEAPKNYVDFEDEEEKLRELLKDRGVKERTIADNIIPNFEKPFAIERSSKPLFQVASSSSLYTSPALPSPPAINSPSTPRSILSAPPSPTLVDAPAFGHTMNDRKLSLALKCYIATRGRGTPITALKTLQDGQVLVTLHERGSVNVSSSVSFVY